VDDADRAQMDIELSLNSLIKQQRVGLAASGQCYNCGNGIGAELLFCDRDCRDDYEKLQSSKSRAGIAKR